MGLSRAEIAIARLRVTRLFDISAFGSRVPVGYYLSLGSY